MAQQDQWWLNDKPVAQAASRGVEIPAPPPKPESPPAGYEPTDAGLSFTPGGPADPAVIAAQAAARRGGEGKTATEVELSAKEESADKRAKTVRSIMGRVDDLYTADIKGQPLSRLGGLTEYITALPRNERFNAAANTMLPLIRPLVAQTAKEGDSDKEMQVFMAYIPQSTDSDQTIEEKLSMLETLIGGMVDGQAPTNILATVAPVSGEGVAKLQSLFDQGATAEQIAAEAQKMNLQIPAQMLQGAIQYRDAGGKGASLFPGSAQPTQQPQGSVMQGLGAGVGDIVQGVGDIAGLVSNPLNATINAATGANFTTDLGSTMREMTGLPQGDPTASAIIRGATGAMTGAGVAGALSRALPTGAARVAGTLAQAPLQQGAGGAGAGLGAEMAREQGAGPLGQAGAALLGGVVGAGGAGAASAMMAPRVAMPASVAAAERAGIPVMTSDIAPPTTFMGKSVQSTGERIPLAGTGGLRAGQQDARVAAVKTLFDDYGVGDPTLIEKVSRSLSDTRSAEIAKYTTMKGDVIKSIAGAGDVPVPNAVKAIDDEIVRLDRISSESFKPVVSILRRWRNDLQGKSLDDIEVLRKQVGEEFKSPDLAAVSSEAQKSLNRIYNPLRDDMGDFIKTNGARRDHNKWMIANNRLREGMQELDKSALRIALRDGDATPETVERLLFSGKRSDVASLYRNLGPNGRANARAAVMDKVFKDMGGDINEIAPAKFLSSMRRQANQLGIMFNKDEAARIEGLVSALKLTSRAGEAGVVTNSGQQAVPLALATSLSSLVGGLMGGGATAGASAAGTIGAAGGLGLLARAMEGPAARRALMQLRNANPKEEQAALKRFLAAINATELNK